MCICTRTCLIAFNYELYEGKYFLSMRDFPYTFHILSTSSIRHFGLKESARLQRSRLLVRVLAYMQCTYHNIIIPCSFRAFTIIIWSLWGSLCTYMVWNKSSVKIRSRTIDAYSNRLLCLPLLINWLHCAYIQTCMLNIIAIKITCWLCFGFAPLAFNSALKYLYTVYMPMYRVRMASQLVRHPFYLDPSLPRYPSLSSVILTASYNVSAASMSWHSWLL